MNMKKCYGDCHVEGKEPKKMERKEAKMKPKMMAKVEAMEMSKTKRKMK